MEVYPPWPGYSFICQHPENSKFRLLLQKIPSTQNQRCSNNNFHLLMLIKCFTLPDLDPDGNPSSIHCTAKFHLYHLDAVGLYERKWNISLILKKTTKKGFTVRRVIFFIWEKVMMLLHPEEKKKLSVSPEFIAASSDHRLTGVLASQRL